MGLMPSAVFDLKAEGAGGHVTTKDEMITKGNACSALAVQILNLLSGQFSLLFMLHKAMKMSS